jgi:hypothetical protein
VKTVPHAFHLDTTRTQKVQDAMHRRCKTGLTREQHVDAAPSTLCSNMHPAVTRSRVILKVEMFVIDLILAACLNYHDPSSMYCGRIIMPIVPYISGRIIIPLVPYISGRIIIPPAPYTSG